MSGWHPNTLGTVSSWGTGSVWDFDCTLRRPSTTPSWRDSASSTTQDMGKTLDSSMSFHCESLECLTYDRTRVTVTLTLQYLQSDSDDPDPSVDPYDGTGPDSSFVPCPMSTVTIFPLWRSWRWPYVRVSTTTLNQCSTHKRGRRSRPCTRSTLDTVVPPYTVSHSEWFLPRILPVYKGWVVEDDTCYYYRVGWGHHFGVASTMTGSGLVRWTFGS